MRAAQRDLSRALKHTSPSERIKSHKDGRTLETTRLIDGFGQQTNYGYNNAYRLTSATYAGASAEIIIDNYEATSGGNKGVGRLMGVTDQSGSSAFVYGGYDAPGGAEGVRAGRTVGVAVPSPPTQRD